MVGYWLMEVCVCASEFQKFKKFENFTFVKLREVVPGDHFLLRSVYE